LRLHTPHFFIYKIVIRLLVCKIKITYNINDVYTKTSVMIFQLCSILSSINDKCYWTPSSWWDKVMGQVWERPVWPRSRLTTSHS